MNTLPAVPGYQEILKEAAQSFLERHQSEHLSNDQQLFDRAVHHLVSDYGVQTQTAEKMVHLASTDMNTIRDRQCLDVHSSTETLSVIVDPVTGITWAIPVSLIFDRIINAPDSGRLRITHS